MRSHLYFHLSSPEVHLSPPHYAPFKNLRSSAPSSQISLPPCSPLKKGVIGTCIGENTLDLVLTNLHPFYQTDSITAYTPIRLSDHSVIAVSPRVRDPKSNQKKIVYKRDVRPSRKSMFGQYLNEIDWSFFDSPNLIDVKSCYFTDVLSIGLSYILPEKRLMVHPNEHPWINEDVRRLIKLRQRALFAGNTTLSKLYRNRINRKRKIYKADYYKSKVKIENIQK